MGLLTTAPAQARTISYAMQVGSNSQTTLTLDGNVIMAFRVTVYPQACTSGSPTFVNDPGWTISTSGTISSGSFQLQGRADSAGFGTGSAQYQVTGTVASDPRVVKGPVVTGTITVSDGQDQLLSGCSGSYPFFAIPRPGRPSTGNRQFTSQFVFFNYGSGAVTNLVVQANFDCGPYTDNADVDAAAYGYPAILTSRGGAFALHTYVLDISNDILRLDFTGQIHGRHAQGHIEVSQPPGLTTPFHTACSADYGWRAYRSAPPGPPAPVAFFRWLAVRVPSGSGYRYYFYIVRLGCRDGASAVSLIVNGRGALIRCSAGQGWASGPLAPGRTYYSVQQPVQLRHGRVVRRGYPLPESLVMPSGDSVWKPISGLRGRPPSS